ncbi:MAG: NrsF family protein [Acidocella sp.]|nr:NrsF family protein [Acidocella sp.]
MRTENLIDALTNDLTPVRRLRAPGPTTILWLAITLPALALVTLMMGPRPNLASLWLRPGFALDEALAGFSAIIAAYAAFCAGRPDQPGWKLALPVGMMLIWFGVLGRQCLLLSASTQGGALRIHTDIACIPAIAVAGIVPAIAMVILLRRSPLFRTTHACLCGAMAAAAAAEFSLRLFHSADSFATLLVWQMGSVVLFTLGGSAIGRAILGRLRPRRTKLGTAS